MQGGATIAGRFVIESLAGTGAMGQVWRAVDSVTGETVALKVLAPTMNEKWRERFEREARVLEELTHPGVVRHVASGTTDQDELYLAMEWLEGRDLARRLDDGELALSDAIRIVLQAAEALGAAHRRGIVHRDVKPSNLFLTGDDGLRVKVVDFGIALWQRTRWRPLTFDGALVGTPGYMAPEQGRGERVDARADVFALGCVLFECVTGLPAFVADQTTALLLKILMQEVPRLGEIVENVPEELEDLVAQMLEKDPGARPRDGSEVAGVLDRILDSVSAGPQRRSWVTPSQRPPTMTGEEQRLLSVVLVSHPAERPDPQATLAEERIREIRDRLEPIVEQFDCRVESLADGSVVAIVEGGAATDQAARAARCALTIRRLVGPLATGIATGRARIDERLPVGPVIDRVASLVALRDAGVIRVDELTAGLLDARFVIGGDRRGLFLEGERDGVDAERTLLGRPTPYVGRAREQGMLEAVAAECVEERVARAVLITGAAGMGKSRLRRETVKRLRGGDTPMSIWLMRGDPLRRGATFAVLSDALHRQAAIHADEPVDVRRRKMRARVARHVPTADVRRITAFLCEVIGAPFPEGESVQLETARRNPNAMIDHVRSAAVDLLSAECAAMPVALVIEDMQWADGPTMALVGDLLRDLADEPLLVLGFARPEIDEAFPSLWEARDVTRIPLSPLTRRASEKLVRTVLGEEVAAEHVERLVELASGNPFLLEELVRAAAEGRWDDAPDTVIAVVQARLEALPASLRRLLRAASVFGDSCWRGGLVALLGEPAERNLDDALEKSIENELLVPLATSRFDETEYAFRHDLIREAAYAMLTDEDRAAGHRLAGTWLAEKGESLARVLAEHFERGGDREKAAVWYLRAAQQAVAALDSAGGVELAEAGANCGAEGELLGELRLVQADALSLRGDPKEWGRIARESKALLRPGGEAWYRAIVYVGASSNRVQDIETLEAIGRELLALAGEPSPERVTAFGRAATELFLAERNELAESLMARMESEAARLTDDDPGLRAMVHGARARRFLAHNDRAGYARELRIAADLYDRAGDARSACMTLGSLGFSLLEIGMPKEAEDATARALERARRLRMEWAETLALHNMGLALAWLGRIDEAVTAERAAIDMIEARGAEAGRLLGGSYSYLSTIQVLGGEAEAAVAAGQRAVALLVDVPSALPRARAALAQALLAAGAVAEAREQAAAAAEHLARHGTVGEGEGLIRLMDAETLLAVGERDRAREALRAAAERLRVRAARMENAESFVRNVPEHARTIELAAVYLTAGSRA